MKRCVFLSIVLAAFLMVGCKDPVPVKDMALARQAISRALSVQSEKYAPEQTKAAKEKLLESHDLVLNDRAKDAVKSAGESKKMADAAFDISIPLLARDTIEVAEESMRSASEYYAEKLAGSEYQDADVKLKKAQELFQSKRFYQSYQTALEADAAAKNARIAALNRKDILKDEITEVGLILKKAEEYNASEYSAAKYQLAAENLKIAEQNYDNLDLRKGFSAVEVARINADEAYAESAEAFSSAKINSADKEIQRVEKASKAAKGSDELAAAKESLDNAREMHEEKRYTEAIEFANEAMRFSAMAAKASPGVSVASDPGQEPVDSEGAEKDFDIYRVKSWSKHRDCLWTISKRYYKNPRKWKRIYRANKERIKDPDVIRPGWELKIPRK